MDINLIIQVSTLVVIAIAAIIGIRQLQILHMQIKAQHDWNRRITALRYSFSADPHIREIRSKLDDHLKITSRPSGEISIEEIENSKKEYPNIVIDLQFMLGRLENMCVAIRNSIADEKTCKDLVAGTTIHYYRFFRQYIDNARQLRNNPAIYENLEFYARRWEEESTIEPPQRLPTG